MLKIYYINMQKVDLSKCVQQFDKIISKDRMKSANKYKFQDDKKRSLLAELIVRYALRYDFGLNGSSIFFEKNSFGKPYIKDSPLQFNISHSGEYVICAVSDKPVGIDIEIYGKYQENLLNYFHQNERSFLMKIPVETRWKYFYNLWSLKESFIKYLGRGLSFPLGSFEVVKNQNDYNIIRCDQKKFKGKIKLLSIDSGYACAICFDSEAIDEVRRLEYDLLKELL